MRLIDADTLLEELKKSCKWHAESSRELSLLQRDINIVKEQPTVDAVHVIRCKDCKFHHDRTQCSKRIGAWFDDDYCNGAVSAERKEE